MVQLMTYTLRMFSANGVGIPRAAKSAAYSGSIDPLMLFISCLPSCLACNPCRHFPVQENALVLANNPSRVPFIVDPANACTTWLQSFLAKVRGLSVHSTGRETRKSNWPEQMGNGRLSADQRGWPTSRVRCIVHLCRAVTPSRRIYPHFSMELQRRALLER